MNTENHDSATAIVCSGPEQVAAYRMLAIRSALRLESVGLKMSRGMSALKIVRAEFGVKSRTAVAALPEYEQILRNAGILR